MLIRCYGIEKLSSQTIKIPAEGIFIGSDPRNEIICDVPGISGRHIRLFPMGKDLYIEDIKSLNGTFFNGEKITKPQRILSGDIFHADTWQIRFQFENNLWELFFEKAETSFFIPHQEKGLGEKNNPDSATAMTVMADANIKDLIKAGKIDKLAEAQTSSPPVVTSIKNILTEGREIGKYIIVKRIGKGGMGEIYLARHKTLEIYRALKILPKEFQEENNDFFERFIREAKLASEIKHPNVVGVMDVESDETYGVSYIVMEYIDGGSLRRILKSTRHLSEEQSVIIVEAVAAALLAAEERKIVHRDIKPDNIMFTKRGEVKLADLGIAKNDDEDSELTKANVMIGTPAYLSPEQVQNAKDVDTRADIYSLGATFYEMLTGQHPYPGKTTYDILHKLFSDPVPDPRRINPAISAATAEIVMKMLAKDASERFQTVSELIKIMDTTFPRHTASETTELITNAIAGICDGNITFNSNITNSSLKLNKSFLWRKLPKWGIAPAIILPVGIAVWFFYNDLWLFFLQKNHPAPQKNIRRQMHPAPMPEGEKLYPLTVNTTPDAEVRITDGNGVLRIFSAGKSGTLHIPPLKKGIYVISIQMKNHFPFEKNFEVSEVEAIDAILTPNVIKITLSTTPFSTVFLSGRENQSMQINVPETGQLEIPDIFPDVLTLKIEKNGFITREQTLAVEKNQRINLPLSEILADLNIISIPDAKVELTRENKIEYTGRTDVNGELAIHKISYGEYKIKISRAGYLTEEIPCRISGNKTLTLKLQQETFKLNISVLSGSTVQLVRNNKIVDTFIVPSTGVLALSNLTAGKYDLRIEKEGYSKILESITMNADREITLFLTEKPRSQMTLPPTADTALIHAGTKAGEISRIRKGVFVLLLNGDSSITDYALKTSAEIKIGAATWQRLRTLRYQTELDEGEYAVSIRIAGMQPMSAKKIKIARGQTSEVIFSPMPYPATLTVQCDAKNAEFCVNSIWHKCGTSITVSPFVENKIIVRAPGYVSKDFSARVDTPGKNEQIPVPLKKAVVILSTNMNYKIGDDAFKEKKYKEALEAFLCAASDGDPEGAYRTALIYEKGVGLSSSDAKRAMEYFRKAANSGHADSAYRAAWNIQNGDMDGTHEEIVNFYTVSAGKKHTNAMFELGVIYRDGRYGMEKNENRALELFIGSAKNGKPQAMYAAGILLEKKYEFKEAIRWYEEALKKGIGEAGKRLNILRKLR